MPVQAYPSEPIERLVPCETATCSLSGKYAVAVWQNLSSACAAIFITRPTPCVLRAIAVLRIFQSGVTVSVIRSEAK
jgi:hypothetical protein